MVCNGPTHPPLLIPSISGAHLHLYLYLQRHLPLLIPSSPRQWALYGIVTDYNICINLFFKKAWPIKPIGNINLWILHHYWLIPFLLLSWITHPSHLINDYGWYRQTLELNACSKLSAASFDTQLEIFYIKDREI